MRIVNVDIIICDRCTKRVELRHGKEHGADGYSALSLRNMRAERVSVCSNLSQRERQVMEMISKGKPNKVIARELDCAEATVKVHVKSLMRKTQSKNRTQAAITMLAGQQPYHGAPEKVTAAVELVAHLCSCCVEELKTFMQNGSAQHPSQIDGGPGGVLMIGQSREDTKGNGHAEQ